MDGGALSPLSLPHTHMNAHTQTHTYTHTNTHTHTHTHHLQPLKSIGKYSLIYIFEKYSNKNIVREVKIGGRHRSTDINLSLIHI